MKSMKVKNACLVLKKRFESDEEIDKKRGKDGMIF